MRPLRRPERYSCDSTGSQLITRDNQRLRAVVHSGLVHKEPTMRGIYSLTDAGRRILGL